MNKVFVYGTLKEGQPNHPLFNKGAASRTFLGSGVTVKKFPLVIERCWYLPCLLYIEDKGKNVRGEVYEVDEELFRWLDMFEDHPSSYQRRQIEIHVTHSTNGSNIEPPHTELCWCYFYQNYNESFLDYDFLEDYDSKGSHGMEYDESEAEEFKKETEPQSQS